MKKIIKKFFYAALILFFVLLPETTLAYNWEKVGANNLTSSHIRVTRFKQFNGKLYAVVQHVVGANTTTQIWYSQNGDNWTRSTGYPENYSSALLNDMEVFGGMLYVAQSNSGTPNTAIIYRSADGLSWTQVSANGFGDLNNYRIIQIYSYNNYIYATTFNIGEGFQIWRSTDGTTWNEVVQAHNGFGDINNLGIILTSSDAPPAGAGGF